MDFILVYDNIDVDTWNVYSCYSGFHWHLAIETLKFGIFLTFLLSSIYGH
jgi:hypothetical protein